MKTMNYSLAAVAALTLLAASAVQAGMPAPGAAGNATSTRAGVWCERIVDIAELGNERLKIKQDEWQERRSEIKSRFEFGRKYRDEELARWRNQRTIMRNEHFEHWQLRATTTEQKSAVAAYVDAVKTAVAKRQEAIDKAIAEQRTGIDRIKDEREARFEVMRKSHDEAVTAAIGKARSGCQGGGVSAGVQSAFRSDLKALRAQFATDVKAMERDQAGLEALKKARRQSFESAIAAYQVEMKKAQEQLVASFGKNQ